MGEDPQAGEIEELLSVEATHLMKGRGVVSRASGIKVKVTDCLKWVKYV